SLRLGLVAQAHLLDRRGHRVLHPRWWQLLQQREVLHELHHREARVVAQVLRQVAEPAADLLSRAVVTWIAAEQPQPARARRDHRGQHPQQGRLARPVRAQQPEHPRPGRQGHPGHRLGPAEPPGQLSDLNVHGVHEVPLGIRVAYTTIAPQPAANAREGTTRAESVTAAVNRPVATCADSTVIAQPARPAATPPSAAPASVPAARASAQTAVIGTSQPKVTATAAPDAAEAASPSAAVRASTASARTSGTIRSLPAMLHDSSQAGSIPGPEGEAVP